MINDLNPQALHQQQHPHDAEMERRLSLQQQSQHQVSQLSNGGGGYQPELAKQAWPFRWGSVARPRQLLILVVVLASFCLSLNPSLQEIFKLKTTSGV